MDEKKALETLQKQYKRQNEFVKNNYDRLSIVFEKGTKERIRAACPDGSINDFIKRAVYKELDRIERN